MNRKAGISVGILILVLGVVGLFEVYYVAMVGISGVRLGVKRYQEDIYALKNSVDAAYNYLDTSMDYSIYQACFDTLKNGGWGKNAPDDKKMEISEKIYYHLADADELKESLEKSILTNINTYATGPYTFKGIYTVSTPGYSSVNIESAEIIDPVVEASAVEDISITRSVYKQKPGDSYMQLKDETKEDFLLTKIEVTKKANLENRIVYGCTSVYRRAVKEKAAVELLINNQLQLATSGLLRPKTPVMKDTPDECNELIATANETAKTALEKDEDGVKIEVLLLDLAIELAAITAGTDGKYECKFQKTPDKSEKVIVFLNVDGDVIRKYPVWNGEKLSMEKNTVKFIVENSIGEPLSAEMAGTRITGIYYSNSDLVLDKPIIIGEGGLLTINGGTISAAPNIENLVFQIDGGKIIMNDGFIMTNGDVNSAIEILRGEFEMSGGTVSALNTDAITSSPLERISVKITISGGSIQSEHKTAIISRGAGETTIRFDGDATVSGDNRAIVIEKGKVTRSAGVKVTIKKQRVVIGENQYTAIVEQNVNPSGYENNEIPVTGALIGAPLTEELAGTILSGKYYSNGDLVSSSAYNLQTGAYLTVNSGSISTSGNNNAIIINGGTLEIIDGTRKGNPSSSRSTIWLISGSIIMNGGNIESDKAYAIKAWPDEVYEKTSTVSVTMSGGKVYSKNNDAINCKTDRCTLRFNGNSEVEGKTRAIVGEQGKVTRADGVIVTIKPAINGKTENYYSYDSDKGSNIDYKTEEIPILTG